MPVLVKQLKKHFDNKEFFSYMFFDKSLWTKIRTTNQTELTNKKFRKKIRRERLIDFMYYFYNHNALKLKSEIMLVIVKSNNSIIIIILSDYKFFSEFVKKVNNKKLTFRLNYV